MQTVYTALIFSMMASPVFAEAPGKPAPLFPDAPPPPQIAPSGVPACCTTAGRFSWLNPSKDQPPIEGAACEAKTSDGLTQAGTVCY
jgi:hypothetical protein